MKKYDSPELEIEKFTIDDVITTSGQYGEGEIIDPWAGMEF